MRTNITIKVTQVNGDTWQYEGIDSVLNKRVFKNTMEGSAEGIAEFCGAIHGLMFLKKGNLDGDVFIKTPYIRQCLLDQKYPHNAKGEKAQETLRKAKFWLLERKSGINIELIPRGPLQDLVDAQVIPGIPEKPKDETLGETPVQDVSEAFKQRKDWYSQERD